MDIPHPLGKGDCNSTSNRTTFEPASGFDRSRLPEVVAGAWSGPAFVLIGPTGVGKTTLLYEGLAGQDHSVGTIRVAREVPSGIGHREYGPEASLDPSIVWDYTSGGVGGGEFSHAVLDETPGLAVYAALAERGLLFGGAIREDAHAEVVENAVRWIFESCVDPAQLAQFQHTAYAIPVLAARSLEHCSVYRAVAASLAEELSRRYACAVPVIDVPIWGSDELRALARERFPTTQESDKWKAAIEAVVGLSLERPWLISELSSSISGTGSRRLPRVNDLVRFLSNADRVQAFIQECYQESRGKLVAALMDTGDLDSVLEDVMAHICDISPRTIRVIEPLFQKWKTAKAGGGHLLGSIEAGYLSCAESFQDGALKLQVYDPQTRQMLNQNAKREVGATRGQYYSTPRNFSRSSSARRS